ncbi:MAG: porin [Arcobacter sp.]|nr:MAG: porin [Arcobacter sp.]
MKFAKVSLMALLAIGTSSFAADSLEDAFKNGKFSGEFRFLYTTGSKSDVAATNPANNSKTGSIAVEMNYLTDSFYGFNLGLGAQSAHDLGFHDRDGSTEDDSRNTVSSSHLNNLYLKYSMLKSNIIVGRQTIKLPILMSSGAFPLEDSFDAVSLNIKEIPNTFVNATYVKKWNKRYGSDSSGSVVQEDTDYKKPLYSLYIRNKSIENLTLDGQYLMTNENSNNGDAPVLISGGYDEYFLRANYKFPIDFPLSLGITYGGADFDATGAKDTSFYGLKLGTKVGDFKLNLAYTSVDDDNSFPGTLGHVPDTILYTNMLTNNGIFAGTEAVSLEAIYDFGIENLYTSAKVAHFDQSNEGMLNSSVDLYKSDEINIDIRYKFSGALKGFSTRLYAGYGDYDENVPKDTFSYARLYINYKF